MRFYRPLSPIKAMTFDLDDTLYNNEPIISLADASLTAFIAANFPRAAALPRSRWNEIKRELIKNNPPLGSDMGLLRLETLRVALADDVAPCSALEQAAQDCFNCFYHARSDFRLDDKVHEVMSALAKKVPLIAITNGNVDTQKTGLTEYFEAVLHASVVRPSKPAPDMFHEAADMLSLPPEAILHVGDNLEKDVMGAIKAGMQSAWIAANREMNLSREAVTLLPHVELSALDDLLRLA
ncbi:HAD-IA family hydrolase [Alteromonas confluentis]|uniref:Haloacid dehalogenase n=1 Tax=Alteromonas confluentis TaxID=1656094 RepID=A0A1E7Z9P4_9ALTE|nr:HAD-IA family hydrolase [Alteromonas confluentis]OFC70197.1 haloacid dehalogenase [Alteromonas confluentis]